MDVVSIDAAVHPPSFRNGSTDFFVQQQQNDLLDGVSSINDYNKESYSTHRATTSYAKEYLIRKTLSSLRLSLERVRETSEVRQFQSSFMPRNEERSYREGRRVKKLNNFLRRITTDFDDSSSLSPQQEDINKADTKADTAVFPSTNSHYGARKTAFSTMINRKIYDIHADVDVGTGAEDISYTKSYDERIKPVSTTAANTKNHALRGSNDVESTTSRTRWYTLSHYIPPNSFLYDSIQGVLLGILFCLVVATCYSYTYYCCFVRCGLCVDDRLDSSLLNSRSRRRKRIGIPNRWGRGKRSGGRREGCFFSLCRCCGQTSFFGSCWPTGSEGFDGRGFFIPVQTTNTHDISISNEEDSVNTFDDHSSLSDDSALTLEYGDDHLHDEYGEVTDRLNDAKVEVCAKEYFEREAQEATKLSDGHGNRRRTHKRRKGRKKADSRCGRSNRSMGNGSWRSTATQTSSILSSSSSCSSSFSSSTDASGALEVEQAMMDLELAKKDLKRQA